MAHAAETLDRLVAADRLLNNIDLPRSERTAAYALALHHTGLIHADSFSPQEVAALLHTVENGSFGNDPAAQADAASILASIHSDQQSQGAKAHALVEGLRTVLHAPNHPPTDEWEGAVARIQTDNAVPGDWYYYRPGRRGPRMAVPGVLLSMFEKNRRGVLTPPRGRMHGKRTRRPGPPGSRRTRRRKGGRAKRRSAVRHLAIEHLAIRHLAIRHLAIRHLAVRRRPRYLSRP